MATSDEVASGDRDGATEISNILQHFADEEIVNSILDGMHEFCLDERALELCRQRLVVVFDRYQEQPHLLDPHLDGWLARLLHTAMASATTNTVLMHECFRFVYVITKVRGFKVILRHLPHEVADLEPVLSLLSVQDPSDKLSWETRYVLLLWLSIIVMIPFHMTRLDGTANVEQGGRIPVIERIIQVAKSYLALDDKPLDAASYLLARFVTRPDVKETHLLPFIEWATQGVSRYSAITTTSRVGELATLALIFKHGKREDLLPLATSVLDCLLAKDFKSSNNTSLRKLSIKLTQRIGMTFLKPRLASWRYQRGSRSLEVNLGSAAVGVDGARAETSTGDREEEEDDDIDVPEEVESVLQELLNGLKDKETVIRWSAAKGIGRVTGRLPKYLADEVVGSVLECFKSYETDCAWHGGCFAIAELGRRGLLLPERLPDVVPVILQALLYDEQKGSYSVGDHIRDAACYVSWAFARAYEPQEMKPYVTQIANALVIATVFDREVHCRRAASAAFQENVGRQGTFPYGIDILTAANYFTVGNRNNTFLELSVTVCQFPEYVRPLIDHLAEVKLHHWDATVRELAAAALRNLSRYDVQHVSGTLLPRLVTAAVGPQLNSRHGSLLAVAEILHGLTEAGFTAVLEDQIIAEGIKEVIPKLNEKKLFRGMGGELMRVASCVLIRKASISLLPVTQPGIIEVWQNLIDDCLRHTETKVQASAAAALEAFCRTYYNSECAGIERHHQKQLIDHYIQAMLSSSTEASRIGFTVALGTLPEFILLGQVDEVVTCLIGIAKIGDESTSMWARSRKEAIKSLSNVCTTLGISLDGSPRDTICCVHVSSIVECFLEGLRDYTTDSCGDIGSHVRLAAMSGLENVVRLMSENHPERLSADFSRRIMCGVAQQAVERIENVRNVAGNIFYNFLHRIALTHIPNGEELRQIFEKFECADVNWKCPAETFFRFAKMLSLPAYTYSVLLGFCTTTGGLTEHLVRDGVSALDSHLNSAGARERCERERLGQTLLSLFSDHLGVTRVTTPLMKTVDRLMSSGSFDDILQDPDSTFAASLLELVRREVGTCRDPSKVMVGLAVVCELLQCPRSASEKALGYLAVLLCHRYPVVRKDAAGKMFTAFVSYDHVVPEASLDETLALLSETDWGSAIDVIRPVRNRLCALLLIPQPQLVKKVPVTAPSAGGEPLAAAVLQ